MRYCSHYAQMREMFFDEREPFDNVLAELLMTEERINRRMSEQNDD